MSLLRSARPAWLEQTLCRLLQCGSECWCSFLSVCCGVHIATLAEAPILACSSSVPAVTCFAPSNIG